MTELNLLIEDRPQRIDVLVRWLPRVFVAIAFLGFGWQKFDGDAMFVRIFDRIGFGQWFRYFTGVMQVGGAVLVLIPATFLLGIFVLSCTMIGAMTFWIAVAHAPFDAVIPGVVLIALLGVAAPSLVSFASGRRSG